ncbi:uncharacterized protein LOC124387892 isoform X1 [Tachysurus ichikawai]
MVKYTDGWIVLLDPPERTQSVTVDEDDDDEESTSAVTEVDNAGRSTEYIPRDLPTDDGPSISAHNLSRLPAKELYKGFSFVSDLFKRLPAALGTEHKLTTAYHLQTNATERVNRTLKTGSSVLRG